MRRVIDALANTEEISKAHARNQKENVRFELASFTSTIARSGSAPAKMRNLLRMAGSGNKQPIATPMPTSTSVHPIFLGCESDDFKKRRTPLVQSSGPKLRKITQAKNVQ